MLVEREKGEGREGEGRGRTPTRSASTKSSARVGVDVNDRSVFGPFSINTGNPVSGSLTTFVFIQPPSLALPSSRVIFMCGSRRAR